MAGKLIVPLQEFQTAAIKWRKELLRLPITGIESTLQYMTPRPNIRYKEEVGYMSGNAQFGPYKPSRATDFNLNVDYRTLETFMGSVIANFEPNSAASTILGLDAATLGDAMKDAPTSLKVLMLIADSLSESLNNAIWSGVRNANGDTTQDLFNGFDTITNQEITAGNITANKGNYMKLTTAITSQNAMEIAKEILFSLDDHLRAQDLCMFCTQDFADKYNESYLLHHGGIVYNKEYEQMTVEGSNKKLHIIPLSNKVGSQFIHICPRSNMLVGFDQMSDIENIEVKEFAPFVLTYIATMFFGVQFESIDKRRFKVVELADSNSNTNNDNETIRTQDNGPKATLSLNVADANMGMVQIGTDLPGTSAAKQVTVNANVTIKATPNTGHVFVKWSDNNTNAERTISISENTTLIATFEAEEP